jgi:hypothetical protein
MWSCSRWQLCFMFGKSWFDSSYTHCTLFSPVVTEHGEITSWNRRYFGLHVVRLSLRSKQECLMLRRHPHPSVCLRPSISDQTVSWIPIKSGTRLMYKKLSNVLEFHDNKCSWNLTTLTGVQTNHPIILKKKKKKKKKKALVKYLHDTKHIICGTDIRLTCKRDLCESACVCVCVWGVFNIHQ